MDGEKQQQQQLDEKLLPKIQKLAEKVTAQEQELEELRYQNWKLMGEKGGWVERLLNELSIS